MVRRISTIIRAGVLVILLAVPLIYWSRMQNSFGLPKQVFFQVAVAALLLLFGAELLLDPRRLAARSTPADLPILVFLAWFSLSSVFSMDRAESMRELVYTASLAGIFFLVTRNIETRGQTLALLGAVIAMGVVESAYGIAQRLGTKLLYEARVKEAIPSYDISAWRWDILGTFGNPNHLASYLAFVSPLLLGCIAFLTARPFLAARETGVDAQACPPSSGSGGRPLGLVGAALAVVSAFAGLIIVLACLVLTGARGSWLAAAAGLLLPLAWGLKRGRRSVLALAACVALILVLALAAVCILHPSTAAELAARITGSFTDSTGSMSYRMLGWRISLRMIAERPFLGSGPGTFKILFLPTLAGYLAGRDPLAYYFINEKMNEAHNEFLQTAVETGLPGLVLLLCMLACIFRGLARRLRGAEPADGFLIAGGAAALAAVLIDAIASIPFHVVPTRVAFWAVAGALLARRPAPSSAPAPAAGPRAPAPAWSWAVAAYLAVFSAVSISQSWRELLTDYRFKMATTLNYMHRLPEAVPWFRKALAVSPSSGQLKFYCGSTLVQLGRYVEGAALLEESKRNFQDIYLYKNLGIAYERLGRLDEAVAQYAQWREMGIASHEANNLIGIARTRQGRTRDAEETFKETLRVRPWDLTAFASLAALYIDSGRYDEAIATLKPDPLWKTPDAYALYGVALLKAGRLDEARAKFLQTLELNPHSVKAHNNLAALYYMQDDFSGAIREWEEVLKIEPGNAIAQKNVETARKKSAEKSAAGAAGRSRWPFLSAGKTSGPR